MVQIYKMTLDLQHLNTKNSKKTKNLKIISPKFDVQAQKKIIIGDHEETLSLKND